MIKNKTVNNYMSILCAKHLSQHCEQDHALNTHPCLYILYIVHAQPIQYVVG